jgi:hypothetical protein
MLTTGGSSAGSTRSSRLRLERAAEAGGLTAVVWASPAGYLRLGGQCPPYEVRRPAGSSTI